MTISSCINTIEDIFQLTRSRGAWLRRSGNGGFLLYFNSHAHVERDGNTLCCFACLSLFQLTRSRGAWRIIINTDTNSTDFNSHAHVERDLGVIPNVDSFHRFQLTRSRGAWRENAYGASGRFRFQLTRSRGAWLAFLHPLLCSAVHFNSHAHVERDWLREAWKKLTFISTHTLTWSVTYWFLMAGKKMNISTHTLTWSVTVADICTSQSLFHFNSHAHVERDSPFSNGDKHFLNFNSHAHVERDVMNTQAPLVYCISTHTLTWSVTFQYCRLKPI